MTAGSRVGVLGIGQFPFGVLWSALLGTPVALLRWCTADALCMIRLSVKVW